NRALPSTDVTAETLTDAYVAFIFYCNPQFALDTDTDVLRATFNSPPKSDSKEFQTYVLFRLIQKLDAKDIKTWGQVALDLGVEAPDINKGQSVQKVQQYTVRLKRWMRAMHIDAFFEYLLGKQHAYFNEIPPTSTPYPPGGRDGVAPEEDLAIRALDPTFRPKRGRRRNSEIELEEESAAQHGLPGSDHGQVNQLMSAYPQSAHPDGVNDHWAIASAVTPQTFAPWANSQAGPHTAVTTTAPSHLRWQLHGNSMLTSTPHPMTSQPTSMTAHIDAAFDANSKAGATPARKRRKNGPAVSSAWPSANAPGAKPRGRPPVSRSMQDGPYSTFPADPANEKGSSTGQPVTLGRIGLTESIPTEPLVKRPLLMHRSSEKTKLSLQVPQHTGGPVRLATPPPRVLVNGESNDSEGRSVTHTPVVERPAFAQDGHQFRGRVFENLQTVERDIPGFAFEALKRALTSDLLRASIVGRQHRLSGDEAKRLADAVLHRLGVPRHDTDASRDDIARLTAASWLGLGEQFNVPLGPATGHGKRIAVTHFRTDADGYEEIV
ncbi:hypothetical protein BAUCODRAFT_59250, partial [Baudoinia panamericana UAMH 10762]